MSTKANQETSRVEPAINGINSLEDMARMTRDFVEAVEVFRSTNGYQSLVELIDRIPKMEADIQQKENALRKADEDLEKEKRAHAAERERSLQSYADESERFRKEKVGMEQRLTGLQKTSSEKDENIIVLKRREEELKAAGKKVEESCRVKINLLKEKETGLLKISKQLEESQIQVTSLLATLKARKNEVSALKRSLEEAQQSNVHLEKDLVTLRARNEELENFSVQLVDTDPNKM
jgi:chromosome segregation ATPase